MNAQTETAPVEQGAPSIEDIKTVTAEYFGVSPLSLESSRVTQKVVRARHVAICLAARLTSLTASAIGKHFGDRDHTSVSHALRAMEGKTAKDHSLRRDIAEIEALISFRRDGATHPAVAPQPEDKVLSAQIEHALQSNVWRLISPMVNAIQFHLQERETAAIAKALSADVGAERQAQEAHRLALADVRKCHADWKRDSGSRAEAASLARLSSSLDRLQAVIDGGVHVA